MRDGRCQCYDGYRGGNCSEAATCSFWNNETAEWSQEGIEAIEKMWKNATTGGTGQLEYAPD